MSELSRTPNRRDFLAMGVGVFAVGGLIGLARRDRRAVRRQVPVMGTIAELTVVTRDERRGQAAISAALAELHEVQRTMSRFDAASDIGRVNAGAYRAPVIVGAATALVVNRALEWAAATGSTFDPSVGRIVQLWDVGGATVPPPRSVVQRLARRNLHRHVEMTRRAGSAAIAFGNADVALDLGGIAKGYAVDRAVAALRDWGITDGIVNVGGDLYALGRPLDHDAWQVGVRAADGSGRIERVIAVADAAVATSGDYEQFFEHQGTRYHHIIDPATAAPRVTARHSMTILASDCITADAAATATFGLDVAAAQRVLTRAAPGARVL